MKVTIVDIANKLNVTPSTVSRALANNERVSKKTRALVQQTARDMGYQPNQIASALRKGTSDTIGMVVPRINRHFFSNVICGVEEVLNKKGYTLTIIQTSEKIENEINAINTLRKSRVAGIIISLSMETNEYGHLLDVINEIPLVQFDRVSKDLPGPKVINDNYSGAYEVTKTLIKGGCKHFLHLTGMDNNIVYQERKNGFVDALAEANVANENINIVKSELTREAGAKVISELWKTQSFDAVFCAGDYAALGAIDAFKEMSIKVPEEVSVAGYANEPFSELMTPSLTSIEQYGELLGEKLAQAILNKINDKSLDSFEVVPVKLIVRQSTK